MIGIIAATAAAVAVVFVTERAGFTTTGVVFG
jgi:hypothetical protein